ncbi:MAG: cyclopropane-fatty-acyl-phospholipid synthase family protein [Rhodospirillaceae bacterium]
MSLLRRRFLTLVTSAAVACLAPPAMAATGKFVGDGGIELDAPYVPTPQPVVDAMLRIASVGPDDIVYDLGSGDGRLVISAVRDFGAKKGVGVDIDPVRIKEANANAKGGGVADRVAFHQQDLFKFDFTEATVLTMYLLPDMIAKLRPQLVAMKPGTRIVAHDFSIPDWEPEKTDHVGSATIFFYTVPAKK